MSTSSNREAIVPPELNNKASQQQKEEVRQPNQQKDSEWKKDKRSKKKSKRKKKRDRQEVRGEGSEGKTPGRRKLSRPKAEAVLVQRNADNAEPITYAELLKVVKQKASAGEVGSKVGHIRETKKGD